MLLSRRGVLAIALTMAGPGVRAQHAPRTIGFLSANTREVAEPGFRQLLEQLARRGWRTGREILIEARYGDQQPERLPPLARELVGLKPGVLIAYNNAAVVALKNETRAIPIVMISSTDPVKAGLVASLAQPGGNVTGTTYNPLEIAGKAVDLLKVVAPRITRVTVVWNPEAPGMASYKPFADNAADRLQVALTYLDVRKVEDYRPQDLAATRPQALYIPLDPLLVSVVPNLVRFANEHRLPSISFAPMFTEAGGLMALAPDHLQLAEYVADHVDKILRGAEPAALPVRVPTRFKLTVNMKTARALGMNVPRELLMQATEVVQ